MKKSIYKQYKRVFDKALLPKPGDYYSKCFPGLKIHQKKVWQKVLCCFHDDNNPSLYINIQSGGFKCFSCGVRGGDILSFHQKHYRLSFYDSVTSLEAWKKNG